MSCLIRMIKRCMRMILGLWQAFARAFSMMASLKQYPLSERIPEGAKRSWFTHTLLPWRTRAGRLFDGPNSPQYQFCPECNKRCKRVSRSQRTATYRYKFCKFTKGEVLWNVKLRG